MITEYLLLAAFIAIVASFYVKKGSKNFPPGPPGFPLVGHLPLLGPNSHKTLTKWRKSYGPIIGVWFGSFRTVVINDAKLIREAMSMKEFAGRPEIGFFLARGGGVLKGLTFINDYTQWMEQRKFALKNLRTFGVGTKSMEAKIMDEVKDLIQGIRKSGGHVPCKTAFNITILGSLWSILFSERVDRNDPEILDALTRLTSIFADTSMVASLAIFMPWLNKIAPELSGYNKMMKEWPFLNNFIRQRVANHNLSNDGKEPRDFVDACCNQVGKTTDINSSFHPEHEQTIFTIQDMFIAGTETICVSIQWAFAYLINFPEIQKKLQEEIDLVIGRERDPTLADRPSLHYMESVISEVFRHSSVAPLSLFRNCTEDVVFHGYLIPKDTMFITNLYSCHYDEELWGDPENFRPERFLDENGRFQKNENVMSFSVGKRMCIGEGLARDEIFLVLTSLLQIFTARGVGGKAPSLKPYVGITMAPGPFDIVFEER